MKTIKVYGPGCKRCETTETMVKDSRREARRRSRNRKGH